MSKRVTKAILPVAGLGTRVMPLTIHQPKGMIGVVDKPVVHYLIDELIAAGAKEIILVISPEQYHFKKYFDYLTQKDIFWKNIKIRFVVQAKPRGNGDAIYIAKKYLDNEPFLVSFGDDIVAGQKSPLKTLTEIFQKTKAPVLMLESVPKKDVSRYGVVRAKKVGPDIYKIEGVVEKPKIKEAPSNLIVVGHYVLTPAILAEIKKIYPVLPKNKELYLTDAFVNYLKKGGAMYGWRFKGDHFDCGSKLGIIKAQTYFGLRHPEFGKEFKKYLKGLSSSGR